MSNNTDYAHILCPGRHFGRDHRAQLTLNRIFPPDITVPLLMTGRNGVGKQHSAMGALVGRELSVVVSGHPYAAQAAP